MSSIKFTDLLKLPAEKFENLKLIFNSDWDYDPDNVSDYVKEKLGTKNGYDDLLGMYRRGGNSLKRVKESTKSHNPNKFRRFKNGEYVMCFIPYAKKEWLLVNAFRVIDDSKPIIDADEKAMSEVSQFFGRLVITWANRKTRNIIMKDKSAIDALTVKTILEQRYDELSEDFPGYENVDLSWEELRQVIKLKTWKTALENQQAVYLITDTATNKRYVGSATGKKGMLLSRWSTYAENGHGGNVLLKELVEKEGLKYVEKNFRYSILDIFKSTVDEKVILARERWWKKILLTRNREYGYNAND